MILLTGANGLVGSFIGRKFLESNIPFRALIRENSKVDSLDDVKDKIEFVKGDVLDIHSLEKAMEGVTVVVHCAAVVSFNPKNKNLLQKVNISGTTNLLDLAIKNEIDQEKPTFIPLAYQRNLPANVVRDFEAINKLISERDLLLGTQKEKTFAVRRKNQEVAIVKNKIDNEIDELIDRLGEDEVTYTQRKRILENEFVELPSKSNNFSKNQRRYTLYEEFYLSLMKNKAEFQIAQAGTTTDFKILSSATLPKQPISPQKIIIYGIGVVSGFILSFLFVAGRYLLHNN